MRSMASWKGILGSPKKLLVQFSGVRRQPTSPKKEGDPNLMRIAWEILRDLAQNAGNLGLGRTEGAQQT